MSTETATGFQVRIDGPFEQAVERVTSALGSRGFGILTRIDLKAAFAEKLGEDFREYVILGACNPRLAFRAVSVHPEIGLLLPCNVTVEEDDDRSVTVRITDPEVLFGASGIEPDETIAGVVSEARALLGEVAASL